MIKKKDLLCFIYLALRDSAVTTREELIKFACQYGGSLQVTEKEIEEAIDMKLVDFI